ncbi:MAG: glutaredoxin family protein [Thermoleophilia bacterium]|jgi:glutaredoxin-like protein NrdH|nr:glutaredoxin family protein [Thermoleophilia bacterium]
MTEHVHVKLYALSTCGHCKNTKRFLDELDVAYDATEVDLTSGEERKAVIEEVKQYNPGLTFPTLVIGDKVIVGFKEQEIKEALEK